MWLGMANLKYSLVRVVNEVKVILNLIEVEVAVLVKLSLLFLVGGRAGLWVRKN